MLFFRACCVLITLAGSTKAFQFAGDDFCLGVEDVDPGLHRKPKTAIHLGKSSRTDPHDDVDVVTSVVGARRS